MTSRAPTRDERWLALALWVLAFVALLATESAVGFTRDESVYFYAGESYASWFQQLFREPARALTDAAIVRAWDFNHEHPVLMKELFGLSHLLFHETLGWLRPAAAFRLPAFALSALVPALIFLLGSAVYGRTAALFAALSFLLVPRQFFNAELACFDMPVAAMWLLVVYAFWRALEDRNWGVLCGVFFGLALCTKHNALFLPFVLAPFALWRAWSSSEGHPAARTGLWRVVGLFAAVAVLYALLVVSLGPDRLPAEVLPAQPPHAALRGAGGGRPGDAARAQQGERAHGARAAAAGDHGGVRARHLLPALALPLAPPGGAHGLVPRLPRHPQPLRLVLPGHAAARAALPAGLRGGEDGAHRAHQPLRADGDGAGWCSPGARC